MFKQEFKYYKSKKSPPDLQYVINFNAITGTTTQNIIRVELQNTKYTVFGLKSPEKWNAYKISSNPGLIFIQNPFAPIGQRYWCVRSIKDYSKKPNKTNLDAHNVIPRTENWWDFCNVKGYKNLLEQLRWATLGYHHNWNTKVYSEDCRSEFPSDLSILCKYIADLIGYKEFKAEAAIVNYYHLDSTLSGHTDHSEKNLEAPLFSFSFGQTAIFLLGGKTIDVKPIALFLHSGDVIVMSKEARLAYHGVPKILKVKEEPWQQELHMSHIDHGFEEEVSKICCENNSWQPFGNYMSYSRININVRQVLNQGEQKLCK